MRIVLSLVSVAAILVAAACNEAEQAPPSPPAAPAAANAGAGGPAAAAPQLSAAEAPKARHESFEQFGRATKAINNELKGSAPSVETIQRHARYLHEQARLLPGWFPAGSGPDVAPRTRAKQEIWSNPQGFARAEQAFLAATRQFDAAAQSGNIEAVRGALPNLQASCKGCHDGYRGPERD